MISVYIIEHDDFSALLEEYEQALLYIKEHPFYIETLHSYPKYLSRLFKSIDPASIRELKGNPPLNYVLRGNNSAIRLIG